ncbi:hypothetical protein BDZ89DRAFT_1070108 [Hymenopellis radicata]|nr:hypothetical protein BDZ89DRAFT_1070108 [Hymenopellis radicata]
MSLSSVVLLAISLFFALRTYALPVNSTTTAPECGIADADDLRSVYDIVWGCLTTVFACSWLTVHPNVPTDDTRRKGSLHITLERVKLAGIAVIAPEVILIFAMRQWKMARKVKHSTIPIVAMTHGFVFSNLVEHVCSSSQTHNRSADAMVCCRMHIASYPADASDGCHFSLHYYLPPLILPHLFYFSRTSVATGSDIVYASHSNITSDTDYSPNTDDTSDTIFAPYNGVELFSGVVSYLPELMLDLELISSSSFAVHSLGNVCSGGPFDQREVDFDSNSICTSEASQDITDCYFVLEEEEVESVKNSSTPSSYPAYPFSSTDALGTLVSKSKPYWMLSFSWMRPILSGMKALFSFQPKIDAGTFPSRLSAYIMENILSPLCRNGAEFSVLLLFGPYLNISGQYFHHTTGVVGYIGCVFGLLFGGLHCLAWNSSFPTILEHYLWRISALMITILPSLIIRPDVFIPYLYFLARLSLIILSFTSLRSLPSSAYQTVAVDIFIPHF